MPNIELLEKSMPVAPIRIAALEGCRELAEEVDRNLVKFRKELVEKKGLDNIPQGYSEDSFIVECECPRFGTGEGKGIIKESVRGTDLYIMVDVTNYSSTYTVCGHENHMSPDNHFQDLKRIISAATGKAHRINVIMPFLYEGRQHRRKKRESLDCALALRELSDMGVANIITFDAHDPRVQNSIPLNGFDNFFPTYQFLKALIKNVDNFQVDNDHLMIISPDEGAMSRAVYFSNILGVDMGMFYKRRDYSTVVNGKNPIVAHEFLGDSVEGKDVVIIDDMISSGESMLDVAKQIKERHANRVFISLDHCFDQRLVVDLEHVLKSRLDLFTAIAKVYAKRAPFGCRFDNARAAELSLDVFCRHLVGRMEQNRSRGRHSYLLIDDLRFGLIDRSCARPNTRTRIRDTKNLEHPLDRTVFAKLSMKC